MELTEATVQTMVSKTLPWQEVLIMPIGDVQIGVPACDTDRLKRHVEWGLEQGALFLGMGDYVDIASPSNRRALKSVKLYDTVLSAVEDKADRDVRAFLDAVQGTEGKWLGLLEGHHYVEFADGTTTDTRLAQALATPFLGNCAFVRLSFLCPGSKKASSITATLWCHHGAGGGARAGSPLNKLEPVVIGFDADVYLIGHQHKKVAAPLDQLYMTKSRAPRLEQRTKLIACTGSFLKGYCAGSRSSGRAGGTYVERGMMMPLSLGGIVVKIRPVAAREGKRLDINVEL